MSPFKNIKCNENGQYVPSTKEELCDLTHDLSVSLVDVDTSCITDMSGLFSLRTELIFSALRHGKCHMLRICLICLMGTFFQ